MTISEHETTIARLMAEKNENLSAINTLSNKLDAYMKFAKTVHDAEERLRYDLSLVETIKPAIINGKELRRYRIEYLQWPMRDLAMHLRFSDLDLEKLETAEATWISGTIASKLRQLPEFDDVVKLGTADHHPVDSSAVS